MNKCTPVWCLLFYCEQIVRKNFQRTPSHFYHVLEVETVHRGCCQPALHTHSQRKPQRSMKPWLHGLGRWTSCQDWQNSSALNTEWPRSPHQGNSSPHTNKKDSWSIYTEVEIYIYKSWSIYRLLRRPSTTQKKLFHFISITSVSNKKICPKVMKNNHQKVWSVSRLHF